MIRLTASDAGFFNRYATGAAMAPDLFLQGPASRLTMAPDGEWSVTHGDMVIIANTSPAPDGPATDAVLSITSLDYYRQDQGGIVHLAELQLSDPIRIPIASDGPGGFYKAYPGAALADAVRMQGLQLDGGGGEDWFNTTTLPLPNYVPSVIRAMGGDDVIVTGRADDRIHGGRGNDSIEDQGGRNLISGGGGDDVIRLGAWSDHSTARGGSGNDDLTSTTGNDRLLGNRGADTLTGGAGRDILVGGAGNDILQGDSGADRLRGGSGDDVLSGGWDADTFVFRDGVTGHDTITDFDMAEDRIRIRGLDGWDDLDLSATADGTLVGWGDADASVELIGVNLDDLNADHFLF